MNQDKDNLLVLRVENAQKVEVKRVAKQCVATQVMPEALRHAIAARMQQLQANATAAYHRQAAQQAPFGRTIFGGIG